MNSSNPEFQKIYSELGPLLGKVEHTPFFKEKGEGTLFSMDFLKGLKIRNIEFEDKFQKALYKYKNKYGVKIVTVTDLINIDFRMFLTLPSVGGGAIRKAKQQIRSSILEYFVDVKILKGQTKTLYVRRNLYDFKKGRMQL